MFRMNHFIRLFLSGVLLLTFSGVFSQEQEDRLLQLMKQELKYNMEELKKAGIRTLLYESAGHG